MRKDIKAFLKQALSLKGIDGPCLEWPFGRANGYGQVRFKERKYYVHRIVCELAHGKPTDETLEVAHSCHNRRCCRPAHLRWATCLENKKDQRTSTKDPNYKLTQEQVDKIRNDTRLYREIAKEYGVARSQICQIKTGRSWK